MILTRKFENKTLLTQVYQSYWGEPIILKPGESFTETVDVPASFVDLQADIADLKEAFGGPATQLRTQQSISAPVEEGGIQQFSIAVYDIAEGAVVSANIDITAISATMEKSTGGGAFSTTGITQPTFSKGDGRVYCAYQFLAAEWMMGDMYRLTVSGITATIDGEIAYIPMMVWSNLVVELVDSKAVAKKQLKATTINLQQAANTYILFTGTTQDVVIESLLIRLPNVDVSNDANITSISIQTNDVTPKIFIPANLDGGVKANLTAEASLSWKGFALLKTGKLIQLTIAGGAADASTVCDVIVEYKSVVSGGYLA